MRKILHNKICRQGSPNSKTCKATIGMHEENVLNLTSEVYFVTISVHFVHFTCQQRPLHLFLNEQNLLPTAKVHDWTCFIEHKL